MPRDPLLAALAALQEALRTLQAASDDSVRIDRLTAVEQAKAALAAVQSAEAVAFAESQRAAQEAARRAERAAGRLGERPGRGIAAQLALALRISPHCADAYLSRATALVRELPATFRALQNGATSERRALLVAQHTAWLSTEHRAAVDGEVAGQLAGWGDRRVENEVRTRAYALDPAGAVRRTSQAERDRRVTVRPAPDLMCRLSALVPLAEGVAAYATLRRDADVAFSAGDPGGRSRGQLMADALVERVTGQRSAVAVPAEIELVMTDAALLGRADTPGRDEPAQLIGVGPVPAEWARRFVLERPDAAPTWLRRLYRDPDTGQLAAMDSRRRMFSADQRRFLRLRDRTCRTPYCDARIAHADHVVPADRGGPTSIANGQGLCAACNYAKQAAGWIFTVTPPGRVCITTPTGHRYWHRPPDLPGARRPPATSRVRVAAGAYPARSVRARR